MKRQYNQPACVVAELGTMQMMAESLSVIKNSTRSITNASDILVKEENTSDVNLWDDEW